ncbi:MAG: RQC-minor-1 family DNA-binding protein [Ignavibacteriales bacterium]|nr:RQC-minor-1 family DNA-binding protein [Ignavibacteriales bacterium]
MSRKAKVLPKLNAKGIRELSDSELIAILRAADELIMAGGRTLLSRILKGSRERKVLDLKLDLCPSYGYYHELTYAEILKRIDYAITKGYLAIDYLGRLPVLTFTAAGWEIEQNTYSDELLMKLRQLAIGPVQTTDIEFLKGKNRSLIMMLLDKIEDGKDNKLLSVLEEWRKTDYKKVRNRISEVIQSLESPKETVEKT